MDGVNNRFGRGFWQDAARGELNVEDAPFRMEGEVGGGSRWASFQRITTQAPVAVAAS